MKPYDMSMEELKYNLKEQGVVIRPSYCHGDYMFTSFTMPYPLKDKLDRIQKRFGISRSKIVQMLLENVDEKDFFSSIKRM